MDLLLHLQRSTYYYKPQGDSDYNLELMRLIDELFTNLPFLGSRQMRRMLVDTGHQVGRGRVRRLIATWTAIDSPFAGLAFQNKPDNFPQHMKTPEKSGI